MPRNEARPGLAVQSTAASFLAEKIPEQKSAKLQFGQSAQLREPVRARQTTCDYKLVRARLILAISLRKCEHHDFIRVQIRRGRHGHRTAAHVQILCFYIALLAAHQKPP